MASQDVGLEISLRRAEELVRAANTLAFALDDLGAINLPPSSRPATDQAQLRAVATLYLAAELEGAGVIPAAEALTRLARTGGLSLDFGAAAPLIQAFWQSRNERTSATERLGFFSGLFGTPSAIDDSEHPRNAEFEDRMIDLCEVLYRLDEQASSASWGGVAQQTRIRRAAQRLLDNVAQISSGITVFLAQEILATMRQALAILNHPALKGAFGARTVWNVVEAINRRLRLRQQEHLLHVRRGQAGLTVLAWLAEAAPHVEGSNQPLVGLEHPVVAAAAEWLEVSLALGEAGEQQSAEDASPRALLG